MTECIRQGIVTSIKSRRKSRMNSSWNHTRWVVLSCLLWLMFVATLNYASFWGESEFAPLAVGQPGTTVVTHQAGWPVSFCTQIHSRKPMRKIDTGYDLKNCCLNFAAVLIVQLAFLLLARRIRRITIRGLLALTAVAALVVSFATTSSNLFGSLPKRKRFLEKSHQLVDSQSFW